MAEHLVTLTDSNFDEEIVHSEIPALVDFWATWCGPCKMIAPTVEELASEYDGKVKVGKVDVDQNPQTASRFSIRSIPSLLIFKNGSVVEQIVGVRPKADIQKALEKTLSCPPWV